MTDLFPIMVREFRFNEMSAYARREGCLALVIQIPSAMIAPHARQAELNHSQTLQRLAERGGLAAAEAVAVLEDRPYRTMTFGEAHAKLNDMLMTWAAKQYLAGQERFKNTGATSVLPSPSEEGKK